MEPSEFAKQYYLNLSKTTERENKIREAIKEVGGSDE